MFGNNSSHEVFVQMDNYMKCDTCNKEVKNPTDLEWGEGTCSHCISRNGRFIQREDTLWDRIMQIWLDKLK